ncbi:hypothetical protein BC828DRAFT_198956 [Blastocladiella britannica]|nr:hypothetical protein BC828DRAFT_198956 [Blastocladiella britannica]
MRTELGPRFRPFLSTSVFLRTPKASKGAGNCIAGFPWINFVLKLNSVNELMVALEAASVDGKSISLEVLSHFLKMITLSRSMQKQKAFQRVMLDRYRTDSPVSSQSTSRVSSLESLVPSGGPKESRSAVPPELVDVAVATVQLALGVLRFPIQMSSLVASPVLIDMAVKRDAFRTEDAARLLDMFHTLDTDRDGALSRTEAERMCNGVLTTTFLDALMHHAAQQRRIRNRITSEPKPPSALKEYLDWPTFAAFQLAAKDVHRPASVQWMLTVLDRDHTGHVTEPMVRAYATDAVTSAQSIGLAAGCSVEDTISLVLDLCGAPRVPQLSPGQRQQQRSIPISAVVKRDMGGSVVRMLVDLYGVHQFEDACNEGNKSLRVPVFVGGKWVGPGHEGQVEDESDDNEDNRF